MFSRQDLAAIQEAVGEIARLRSEMDALRAELERLKPLIERPTTKKDKKTVV